MAEPTTTPPKDFKSIYEQLVGDDGVKFNITFDMIDIAITLAGLFAVLTSALVLAGRINNRLDK